MTDDAHREGAVDDDTSVTWPPVTAGLGGEVVVALQPEGLIVGGDPDGVESYLKQLRELDNASTVTRIDRSSLGNTTGLVAGALSLLGDSGKFVQLHPDSIQAIKNDNLVPGTDGFFRMMTRSPDMKYAKQLQWKPANLNPAQLVSVQMVAVQLALQSAVGEIADAVMRVEGKVEQLLQLAQASRSGDVLGDSASIDGMVAYLEQHGTLTDADWDSIATVGPALNRTVEQLRHHAAQTLKAFDANLTLRARAGLISHAVTDNRLGETLSLLVIAEESLYKWQRLRIARVEATQPEHLQTVLDDARDLLARQFQQDGSLYQHARDVLDSITQTETTDGFWFWAVDGLKRDLPVLREDVDRFARARRTQASDWQELNAPSLADAASYALTKAADGAGQAFNAATDGAGKALNAAGGGVARLGNFLSRRMRDRASVEVSDPEDSAG
ncbi:hypothetical protein OS122_24285 [Mycolicibacterium mucogenicum]|uniref:hypothetical protein n=1 Tax=Mycolicibacterium mucogenicum TaxID=56689 RepID=UPI002269C545|nr:hypothetical protein [Mycolicibacterium mucogenicum]MCX8564018.1 hypothetical protein [Mycolicibacterium mucogenicum]